MNSKIISLLFYVLITCAGLLSSCSAIIEPSISKRAVQLEAPYDQYKSNSYTINFWWDQVDDALHYRLQVVTPKFDSAASLVADTLIKGNKFSLNLSPGNYQWRVRAENGSSQTPYTSARNFTIYLSSIKQQSVQLSSPANNFLTNQGSVNFQWGSLYGATKYQLEIDTNNFVNESTIVYNQLLSGQQFNFTFPKDQTYQWRVKAQNDTAQAQWSAISQVTYDHTPPSKVSLTAPSNGLVVTMPVTLQWSQAATAVKYRLYLYKSDSTTIYNTNFPATVTTNSYSFNLGVSGDTVYWKVTAIDASGNESQASELRNFVLQ
jgi:hypothetical protein